MRAPSPSPTIAAEVAELKALYLGCLIDLAGWKRRMRRLQFTPGELAAQQKKLMDARRRQFVWPPRTK